MMKEFKGYKMPDSLFSVARTQEVWTLGWRVKRRASVLFGSDSFRLELRRLKMCVGNFALR